MNSLCHKRLRFESLFSKEVIADFEDGRITSDAGGLLLRELDHRYRLAENITRCLHDPREVHKVKHDLLTLVRQRILQETLFDLRMKVRTQKAHWTDAGHIEKHYAEACERPHLPKNLYEVALENHKHKKQLLFRKNYYRIDRYLEKLGKNILVTDLADWSTDHIVQASLDRYRVEKAFRQSKDDDLVSLYPLRHWTDSKIRCHIFP